MSKVGVRALKQNASAVVAEVAAGEPITITDRGRPVAQLVPISSSRIETLIAAGRGRPARRSLIDLPRPARRRRGAVAISEELSAGRAVERY
jgi:prevent-host-death family protein